MDWMFVAVVLVGLFALAILSLGLQKQGKETNYPYNKVDALFSPAERSFLGVLALALDERAVILGKVRVADVVSPKKGLPRSEWQKAFNKISAKHFDFLLCDKDDLSILCAIELNDSSHNSRKRKARDDFLEGVCKSADVPLVQVAARSAYRTEEIRESLAPYIPSLVSQEQRNLSSANDFTESDIRYAPEY